MTTEASETFDIHVEMVFHEDGEHIDLTFKNLGVDEIDALFDQLGTVEGRNQLAAALEAKVMEEVYTDHHDDRSRAGGRDY